MRLRLTLYVFCTSTVPRDSGQPDPSDFSWATDMRTVALYGNSLALASIAASLQARAGLQVVPAERLGALQPDALVFDLTAGPPEPAIARWKAQPRLLLVGVDLAGNRMLVLSGQPARVLTAEELVHVIETHQPPAGTQP